jgi:hypothetical protein
MGNGRSLVIIWRCDYELDGRHATLTIEGVDLWEVLRQAALFLRDLDNRQADRRRGGDNEQAI